MRTLVTTGALACAGILALAPVSGASNAEARELIYSSGIPAKHPLHEVGLPQFFKDVEEATGGELTFELFPGGTLASSKVSLNAVTTGTVDMALLADIYHPGDLPTSTLVSDLAVLGKDARVMTGAVNEMLVLDCEACREDYLEENVVPLASYSLTPYHFMCVSDPIATADDPKGKKVRATGSMGQLVAGLGGTAVNITSAEIYEALQRGQADCALGPVPWLKSYSLWDLVKNVSAEGVGTYHGTNFINMRKQMWQKLSAEERKAIIDAIPAAIRRMAEVYEKDDIEIKNAAIEKGVNWVEPEESLVKAVEQFRQGDIARVMEVAKSRGVENPEPVVELFRENVEKWTKIVSEIGEGEWGDAEWDKYQATLKSEIYDKRGDS